MNELQKPCVSGARFASRLKHERGNVVPQRQYGSCDTPDG